MPAGAIITNQAVFEVFWTANTGRVPGNFYEPLHGHLFGACKSMHVAGQRIDVGLTVAGSWSPTPGSRLRR